MFKELICSLRQPQKRKSHVYFVIKLLITLSIIEFCIFLVCLYLMSLYEAIPLIDSFYLSVITFLTVGYGDLHPLTFEGRQVAMIISSTGTLYMIFLSALMTIIFMEGKVFEIGSEVLMQRKIDALRDHVIICGLGRAGTAALMQLITDKQVFVGIDSNNDRCNELQLEGHLIIEGDATQDILLKKAGIERAKSIIAILPDDGNNVLIALAAKDLNKNIRVVTRANRIESEERLIRAGADCSLTVGHTGGTQLAMMAVKPAAGNFVRQMLDFENLDLKLEEAYVSSNSVLANKKIIETNLRKQYDVQILAIIRDGTTIANLRPQDEILPNDTIIIFGNTENVIKALYYLRTAV